MAITPRYSWPLPDAPDAPNIPFDMNALAVAQEATVGAMQDLWIRLGISGYRIEAGSAAPNSNSSGVAVVTFAVAFASKPVVVAIPGDNFGLDPAKTLYVQHPAGTATTFQVAGFQPSVPVRVQYVAIGPATPVTAHAADAGAEQFITVVVEP